MKKSNQSIFQGRLLEVLRNLNISQAALARRLNVTQQTVQQWCAGKTQPRMDVLDRLAEVADKPVHWFFLPHEASEVTENVGRNQSTTETQKTYLSSDGNAVSLSPDEEQLINVYRELPGMERRNMLDVFTYRLKEINNYVARYLEPKRENK